MPQAIWNNVVVADSAQTVVVEGNHYFPPNSIISKYFSESSLTTVCGWKGTAHYYDLNVDGSENKQAAWYYPTPKEAAASIKGRIAFWKGVEIRE